VSLGKTNASAKVSSKSQALTFLHLIVLRSFTVSLL